VERPAIIVIAGIDGLVRHARNTGLTLSYKTNLPRIHLVEEIPLMIKRRIMIHRYKVHISSNHHKEVREDLPPHA